MTTEWPQKRRPGLRNGMSVGELNIDAARERSPLRWGGDGDGDAS